MATAPGIPQTVLVGSSWASTVPPCSRMMRQPLMSVRAHAGEHDGEDAGAVDFGRGTEEDIDGGAAVILKRALGEVQRGRSAGMRGGEHLQVPVAAGDVDGSGADGVALGASRTRRRQRPLRRSAKRRVKSSGMCCTMSTGKRKARGKRGKQNVERGGTSGGDANGDHGGNGGDGLRP